MIVTIPFLPRKVSLNLSNSSIVFALEIANVASLRMFSSSSTISFCEQVLRPQILGRILLCCYIVDSYENQEAAFLLSRADFA